jgi:hypothetical protein
VAVYLRDRLRDLLRDLLRLRVRPPDRLRERDFLRLADLRFLRAPPDFGYPPVALSVLAAGLIDILASGLAAWLIDILASGLSAGSIFYKSVCILCVYKNILFFFLNYKN